MLFPRNLIADLRFRFIHSVKTQEGEGNEETGEEIMYSWKNVRLEKMKTTRHYVYPEESA